LGAVPVARKVEADGKGAATAAVAGEPPVRDSKDMGRVNDAAFDQMFGVLERGDAIGIFPEGLSHDESQLAKLKTGAVLRPLDSP